MTSPNHYSLLVADRQALRVLLGLPTDAVIESVSPDPERPDCLRVWVRGFGHEYRQGDLVLPGHVIVHQRVDADGTWFRCEPQAPERGL